MTYEIIEKGLVYGIGTFGVGKFKSKIDGKITNEYNKWTNMLARCYSYKYHAKNPDFYKECSVEESWLNFQVFAEWYTNQSNYGKPRYSLDKDLTVLGSNLYSKDTCYIVHPLVNSVIKFSHWGESNTPQGVQRTVKVIDGVQRYFVRTPLNGVSYERKGYLDSMEAFYEYKRIKEMEIKRIAGTYKHEISNTIYENLMNFVITPFPDRATQPSLSNP